MGSFVAGKLPVGEVFAGVHGNAQEDAEAGGCAEQRLVRFLHVDAVGVWVETRKYEIDVARCLDDIADGCQQERH